MMATTLSAEELLAHAREPEQPLTKAFAGTIAHTHLGMIEAPDLFLGLDDGHFSALVKHHFPGARTHLLAQGRDSGRTRSNRLDELNDIVMLLMNHRSHERDEALWLAHAIASGCMGGDHLYKDMGLPDRSYISSLMQQHFTTLFDKNIHNMKWKRFFYKQLCDMAEVKACRAPTCQACGHYNECYLPVAAGTTETESH